MGTPTAPLPLGAAAQWEERPLTLFPLGGVCIGFFHPWLRGPLACSNSLSLTFTPNTPPSCSCHSRGDLGHTVPVTDLGRSDLSPKAQISAVPTQGRGLGPSARGESGLCHSQVGKDSQAGRSHPNTQTAPHRCPRIGVVAVGCRLRVQGVGGVEAEEGRNRGKEEHGDSLHPCWLHLPET